MLEKSHSERDPLLLHHDSTIYKTTYLTLCGSLILQGLYSYFVLLSVRQGFVTGAAAFNKRLPPSLIWGMSGFLTACDLITNILRVPPGENAEQASQLPDHPQQLNHQQRLLVKIKKFIEKPKNLILTPVLLFNVTNLAWSSVDYLYESPLGKLPLALKWLIISIVLLADDAYYLALFGKKVLERVNFFTQNLQESLVAKIIKRHEFAIPIMVSLESLSNILLRTVLAISVAQDFLKSIKAPNANIYMQTLAATTSAIILFLTRYPVAYEKYYGTEEKSFIEVSKADRQNVKSQLSTKKRFLLELKIFPLGGVLAGAVGYFTDQLAREAFNLSTVPKLIGGFCTGLVTYAVYRHAQYIRHLNLLHFTSKKNLLLPETQIVAPAPAKQPSLPMRIFQCTVNAGCQTARSVAFIHFLTTLLKGHWPEKNIVILAASIGALVAVNNYDYHVAKLTEQVNEWTKFFHRKIQPQTTPSLRGEGVSAIYNAA